MVVVGLVGQCRSRCAVEDAVQAGDGRSGALHVLGGADAVGERSRLRVGDGDSLSLPGVHLGADQDQGPGRTQAARLARPSPAHRLEGGQRVEREADEEHVGAGVGEVAQVVVVGLAGGVPQRQEERAPAHLAGHAQAVAQARRVLAREALGAEGENERGLADARLPHQREGETGDGRQRGGLLARGHSGHWGHAEAVRCGEERQRAFLRRWTGGRLSADWAADSAPSNAFITSDD